MCHRGGAAFRFIGTATRTAAGLTTGVLRASDGSGSRTRYGPRAGVEASDLFAVQVGAFQNRASAERIRGEMEKLYGYAQLVERAGAPPVWRVLVGNERTIDAANRLAERIRTASGAAHAAAFVVRIDAAPAAGSRQ